MRSLVLLSVAIALAGCCGRRASCPRSLPTEVDMPAPTAEDFPRVRVVVDANGDFVARTADGEGELLAEGSMISKGTEEAKAAFERLRDALIELAAPAKWREPDGSSMIAVVLESPKSTKWQHVQWLMQACAHPELRIYKMQMQFRDP